MNLKVFLHYICPIGRVQAAVIQHRNERELQSCLSLGNNTLYGWDIKNVRHYKLYFGIIKGYLIKHFCITVSLITLPF